MTLRRIGSRQAHAPTGRAPRLWVHQHGARARLPRSVTAPEGGSPQVCYIPVETNTRQTQRLLLWLKEWLPWLKEESEAVGHADGSSRARRKPEEHGRHHDRRCKAALVIVKLRGAGRVGHCIPDDDAVKNGREKEYSENGSRALISHGSMLTTSRGR